MYQVYQTIDGELQKVDSLDGKGLWIEMIDPSDEEINLVAEATGLEADLLKAALDEEERPRIETGECQVLILINIPVVDGDNGGSYFYDTLPLGVVINNNVVVTVCLKNNPLYEELHKPRIARTIHTVKKTRFLLQILLHTAALFLRYLRLIDRKSNEIEQELHVSTRNEELIKLLNLEKSLVYFTTSLRSNEIVMEKLLRSKLLKVDEDAQVTSRILKMYEEDEELLEDVITENKQAIEMAEIYSNILSGMMDAFASVISNNLNIVMKFLAAITIILALPTMVASFYGMNVGLPFQDSPNAFWLVLGISGLFVAVSTYIMMKKRML
ncbi:MAG: magnesium transporter CorA family protein [Firmicutes bacterium]|nr:magnesium transporter CorA family protein [Bacillota bacterium]